MKMYLIHKKFNGIWQKEKDLQHDIVCYQQVSIDFFEMIIMLKFFGGGGCIIFKRYPFGAKCNLV